MRQRRALAACFPTPLVFLLAAGLVAASCTPVEPAPTDPSPTPTQSVAPTTSAAAQPSPSASAPPTASAPPKPLTIEKPSTEQRERLRKDVARFAIERTPGSPGWTKTRTAIEDDLRAAGLTPEIQPFERDGKNVLATKPGMKTPREHVILSAHYDHIAGCQGADDNASGVAVVLEAARQLGKLELERTLVLAFWDHEEDGLVGSRAYASRARSNKDEIRVMISLDGVGYADDKPGSQKLPEAVGTLLPDVAKKLADSGHRANFIAALGDTASHEALAAFEQAGTQLSQPAFGVELSSMTRLMMMDASRSDHASFWLAGYPGILITDTANFRNPRYHCGGGPDDPASLDYDFLNRVASLVIAVVRSAARG